MQAKPFLQIVKDKLLEPDKHSMNLFTVAGFYSQPFNFNIVANPIGEVCPVHAKDFSSMRDKDYETWLEAEGVILFKYWMKSEFGSDFTNVKDNCIYFQSDCYVIRVDKNRPETGVRLPLPQTLDDFISDCNRVGIELYWKDEVVKKYFK
jgi:hypothetical protein